MAARPPVSNLAQRRGYHHGNLKEALIEAARRLIAERGPAGFTLSDAAKLAGVSPAAPYRHFKDRQSLLREVAGLGFAALGERLAAAAAAGGAAGFNAMGRAYLAFARDEPAFYAAMFNSGTAGDDSKPAEEDRGFAMLRQAVGRALGTDDPETVRTAAILVFALTHGLASLSVSGSVARPKDLVDPGQLLDRGVWALLHGLPDALAAGR
ncbi:TetR/AcrR family transcriptional regulator [Phreatobacter stygius]|uniref:TetR/AcrR family transcriptional regulator n=1 Tax=Phreatobacter stygius TaxID=1940610 RepID=A0A4D7APW4_9HYPH|nr:TetR/AcrR family transcriptional regulator [Phreatobacter stygius]QCI63254.1 TetR/AcrR family transcriptional regulator [Phreatobacter stygius]